MPVGYQVLAQMERRSSIVYTGDSWIRRRGGQDRHILLLMRMEPQSSSLAGGTQTKIWFHRIHPNIQHVPEYDLQKAVVFRDC